LWGITLETFLLLGVSFFTSIITIKMQDIKHLIELVLQLVFWATPIFYTMSQLDKNVADLLSTINPLVSVLALNRAGLLVDTPAPDIGTMTLYSLGVLAFTAFGYMYFKKNLPKIAEYF
jgi:ABC-type polysaccharide/polyol phosphate export permease